jgi:hypothetical protein
MVNKIITCSDIFKFDETDSNQKKYFDSRTYNIAQQIIQQREFLKVAQMINFQLNDNETFEEIINRMSNVKVNK